MKVLKIPPYSIFSHSRPWLGGFQRDQAFALKESGIEVGFLCIDFFTPKEYLRYRRKENFGEKLSNIEGYNCALFSSVNPFPGIPKLKKKSYIKRGLKLFERFCETFSKPDLVHTHNSYYSGFLALEIKKKFGVPYIVTEHNTAFARGIVPKSLINDIREVFNNSSKNLAVSIGLADQVNKVISGINEDFIIVNNILTQCFQKPLPVHSDKNKNELSLITVGSLDSKKNHSLLIESIDELSQTYPALHLNIIGQGKLESDLKSLVKTKKLGNKVRFLGQLSPEDVRIEMLKADAFVLPSSFETFGVVVIEALSCGLPCLVTACGGPEYIIDETNGIVIQKNNITQLTNGIRKLIQTTSSYSTAVLHDKTIERYGNRTFVERLNSIYQDAQLG